MGASATADLELSDSVFQGERSIGKLGERAHERRDLCSSHGVQQPAGNPGGQRHDLRSPGNDTCIVDASDTVDSRDNVINPA
ncbi:MAG: hypothetical protein R6W93_15385 [Candidatus Limnocylindrales bacterium]